MSDFRPTLTLALAVIVSLAMAGGATAGVKGGKTPAPKAPAGLGFYSPPKKLVKGAAGTPVWTRPARGLSRLPSAGRTLTVLYRSRSVKGKPSVVSGTIAVPKGKAPKGGWPIVSWGHVTTGSADVCAPSRVTPGNSELERLTRGDEINNRLLDLGVAVARSDFEGIGTPGRHPYMIGPSLGRAMVDIVRAARVVDPRINRRWAPAGHSEGGQAALFAAAMSKKRAPELKLAGASAFAPASHIAEILEIARQINFANSLTAGYSALGALILEGAALGQPSLWQVYRDGGISPEAQALLPDTQKRCLEDLSKPDSWGGLAPAKIAGPNAETSLPALYKVLDHNDPSVLKMPGVRVRLDQGTKDLVVLERQTREVGESLTAAGAKVSFNTWPEGDHQNITDLDQGAGPAADWLAKRLK